MSHMTRWMGRLILAIMLILPFVGAANSAALQGPFGHHRARYCLLDHWICWHNMDVGDALPDQVALGWGNINGSVAPGSKVHFIFHRDLQAPFDSVGVIPVDSVTVLSPAVSQALGYDTVTLLPGLYPVDYATFPNGETYIDAILAGPTPTDRKTWGQVKSLYR